MWLWFLLTAVLAILAFAAGSRLFDRVLVVQTRPDEVHFASTADGWRIACTATGRAPGRPGRGP